MAPPQNYDLTDFPRHLANCIRGEFHNPDVVPIEGNPGGIRRKIKKPHAGSVARLEFAQVGGPGNPNVDTVECDAVRITRRLESAEQRAVAGAQLAHCAFAPICDPQIGAVKRDAQRLKALLERSYHGSVAGPDFADRAVSLVGHPDMFIGEDYRNGGVTNGEIAQVLAVTGPQLG